MRGKLGISAIVTTVLIISLIVAAVAILSLAVIPIIKQGATFDDVGTRLDILRSSGYTFYDADSDKLYVQVKRGSDENEMVGMDIILNIEGNTRTYAYDAIYVPGPNQAKIIIIDADKKPEKITVVPVVNDKGTIKKSSVISELKTIGSGVEVVPTDATPFDISCEDNGDCYGGVCYNNVCCEGGCEDADNYCGTYVGSCGQECEGALTCEEGEECNDTNVCECIATCEDANSYCKDEKLPNVCGKDCGFGIMEAVCNDSSTVACGTTIISSNRCGTCPSGTMCANWYDECVGGSCVLKPTITSYQEDADSYSCASGDCDLVIDGNWSTRSYPSIFLYINYTKRLDALSSSTWKFKYQYYDGSSFIHPVSFESIPSGCWSQDVIQFSVDNTVSGPHFYYEGNITAKCWDGSNWIIVKQVSNDYFVSVFEEAMNWTIVED